MCQTKEFVDSIMDDKIENTIYDVKVNLLLKHMYMKIHLIMQRLCCQQWGWWIWR